MRIRMIAIAAVVLAAGTAFAADDVQGKPYPLDTCPVSGEKLGSMGDPVQHDHDGQSVLFCCAGCTKKFEADPAKYMAKIDEAIIEQQSDSYPLDTCVVSGQELGSMGEPVAKVHGNQLVKFCCAGCTKKFEADPATYTAKIDEAVIAAQSDSYPLDTCVVSGQELGSMGDPVTLVAGNQLVKFCCAGCTKKFNAHPSKYLSKIESARGN